VARPANLEARAAMEQAARQAFARVGPVAARVEDIARAAGLSKAAFYLYFDSKASLFEALVREFFAACAACSEERHQALHELVETLGPCDAADWAERTPRFQQFSALDHTYTLRFLRVLWEWRDMLECLLDRAAGAHREQVDALVAASTTGVTQRLQEAMEHGWLRDDVDPALASDVLVGAYTQLGRRMFGLQTPPDFEIWARVVETIINEGLRPRASTAIPLRREGAR
jgi:AcrR family transcriptional regulator